MKYYWVHWPTDPPGMPSWFTIGVDDNGGALVMNGRGTSHWYPFSIDRLKQHGLVFGGEIPGPPEAWR